MNTPRFAGKGIAQFLSKILLDECIIAKTHRCPDRYWEVGQGSGIPYTMPPTGTWSRPVQRYPGDLSRKSSLHE